VKSILIISVILNGIGASLIWVAQGEYFSKCATEQTKGFYFGLFWSIYQGSQIFGSYFGGLIFSENYSKTKFFIIMSIIALLATISMAFTKTPYVHRGQSKTPLLLNKEDLYYTTQVIEMARS
jgi:predicted MFS family arabinose efflux permease